MSNIVAWLRLEQRRFALAVFPLFIHAIHPVRHPTAAAFEKSDAQFGEFLRYATINQRRTVDHGFKRTGDGMLKQERIEADFPRWTLAGIVHEQRRVESLQLLIERP